MPILGFESVELVTRAIIDLIVVWLGMVAVAIGLAVVFHGIPTVFCSFCERFSKK